MLKRKHLCNKIPRLTEVRDIQVLASITSDHIIYMKSGICRCSQDHFKKGQEFSLMAKIESENGKLSQTKLNFVEFLSLPSWPSLHAERSSSSKRSSVKLEAPKLLLLELVIRVISLVTTGAFRPYSRKRLLQTICRAISSMSRGLPLVLSQCRFSLLDPRELGDLSWGSGAKSSL